MKTRSVRLPALATLLAGVLMTAPTTAQEAKAPKAQPQDAAVMKAKLGAPLTFSVEGLTAENLEKVTSSLTSLTESFYACPNCKHMAAKAGKCTGCDVALQAKKEPILFEAVPSVKEANVRLTPFAARTLSYSILESAMKKNSVGINGATFPLAGESCLVLRGGTSDDVKSVEKALKDSDLFSSAKASYDAESTEIHVVVRAAAKPPMHDKVAAAIEALETKAILADVVWGPKRMAAAI